MDKREFLSSARHIELDDEGHVVSVYGIIRKHTKPSSKAVFDYLGIKTMEAN